MSCIESSDSWRFSAWPPCSLIAWAGGVAARGAPARPWWAHGFIVFKCGDVLCTLRPGTESGALLGRPGNLFVMRPDGRRVQRLTHWRGRFRTEQFAWVGARMARGRC